MSGKCLKFISMQDLELAQLYLPVTTILTIWNITHKKVRKDNSYNNKNIFLFYNLLPSDKSFFFLYFAKNNSHYISNANTGLNAMFHPLQSFVV
jgi:hypothetical protein